MGSVIPYHRHLKALSLRPAFPLFHKQELERWARSASLTVRLPLEGVRRVEKRVTSSLLDPILFTFLFLHHP